AYVFADATVPEDGESRLDLLEWEMPEIARQIRAMLAAGETLPRWRDEDLRKAIPDPSVRRALLSEYRILPPTYMTEPIGVFPGWPDAPCAYVRFSAGYERRARRAEEAGWPCRRLDGSHFQMLVQPAAVAGALLDVTAELGLVAE